MADKKLSELKQTNAPDGVYIVKPNNESGFTLRDYLNQLKEESKKRFKELPPKKQLYYACNIDKLIDFLFETK